MENTARIPWIVNFVRQSSVKLNWKTTYTRGGHSVSFRCERSNRSMRTVCRDVVSRLMVGFSIANVFWGHANLVGYLSTSTVEENICFNVISGTLLMDIIAVDIKESRIYNILLLNMGMFKI